jgi:hypothetical protein
MRFGLILAIGRASQKFLSRAAAVRYSCIFMPFYRLALTVHLTHLLCVAPQAAALFRLDLHIRVEKDVVSLNALVLQYLCDLFRIL